MDTSAHILVIMLSAFLALFLLLSIIAMAMVVQLLSKFRKLATKAESVLNSAETIGDVFRKSAGPIGFLKFVRSVVSMASDKKGNRR